MNCDRSNMTSYLPACHQTKEISFNKEDPAITQFWTEFAGGGKGISANTISEDCLYLNIWAPLYDNETLHTADDPLPILFFIHGGEFQFDSAFNNLYEGTILSFTAQTIVVTFNYRLGPLGFLYAPDATPRPISGNAGLRDAAKALEWVHHNARAFGGDPDRVTLYGACAGAAVVQYLMSSPMVPPNHYSGAILSSGVVGSHMSYETPDRAAASARGLYAGMDSPPPNFDLQFLQKVDVKEIYAYAKLSLKDAPNMGGFGVFIPTRDEQFFPMTPERSLAKLSGARGEDAKPVMFTYNHDEGSFYLAEHGLVPEKATASSKIDGNSFAYAVQQFSQEARTDGEEVMDLIKQQYYNGKVMNLIEFLTDYAYKCDIVRVAQSLQKSRARDVLKVRFDSSFRVAEKAYPYFGVGHGLELFLAWGRPYVASVASLYTEPEQYHSYLIMDFIGSFVRGKRVKENVLDADKITSVIHPLGPVWDRVETIKDEKCHFIRCLPSLKSHYHMDDMDDSSCMKYVETLVVADDGVGVRSSIGLMVVLLAGAWTLARPF